MYCNSEEIGYFKDIAKQAYGSQRCLIQRKK
jgi:hypothetical protein